MENQLISFASLRQKYFANNVFCFSATMFSGAGDCIHVLEEQSQENVLSYFVEHTFSRKK